MILAEYQKYITTILRDDADNLKNRDIYAAIDLALPLYSKDRPYRKVADISGDGTYTYSLPSDWKTGFSHILKIEYPAGERIPVYIKDDQWTIYDDGTGDELRFLVDTPATGETIRLTYTTIYTNKTLSNIPESDEQAFIMLAAAQACYVLSRHYSGSQDNTIPADSVDYKSKGDVYATRARELMKQYNALMGKKGEKPAAASGIKNLDLPNSRGRTRLTHTNR